MHIQGCLVTTRPGTHGAVEVFIPLWSKEMEKDMAIYRQVRKHRHRGAGPFLPGNPETMGHAGLVNGGHRGPS